MNEKLLKIKELLSQMLPSEETVETNMEALTTDKAVIYVAKVEVGEAVEVGDENGENRTPAEDGEYLLTDGRTLVVAEGKIAEIKEKEDEEPKEDEKKEEETALSKFQKEVQKYEESYGEKEQKIAEAIRKIYVDSWVVEAGDDYAVADVWDEATDASKYVKFAISWTEDGEVELGEETEVVSAFIPKETKEEIQDPVEPETVETEESKMEEEPEPSEPKEDEKEPERDLAKELDELKELVAELQKKLEKVEGEETKTPQEEFEAIRNTDKKLSMAEKYAQALRK